MFDYGGFCLMLVSFFASLLLVFGIKCLVILLCHFVLACLSVSLLFADVPFIYAFSFSGMFYLTAMQHCSFTEILLAVLCDLKVGSWGCNFSFSFSLIGNFTVCGFYFILLILHALRRADDAYFVGEMFALYDLSVSFCAEKGLLSLDSALMFWFTEHASKKQIAKLYYYEKHNNWATRIGQKLLRGQKFPLTLDPDWKILEHERSWSLKMWHRSHQKCSIIPLGDPMKTENLHQYHSSLKQKILFYLRKQSVFCQSDVWWCFQSDSDTWLESLIVTRVVSFDKKHDSCLVFTMFTSDVP